MKKTNEINIQTKVVRQFFEKYIQKDFIDFYDAQLIDKIINNNDNPLLIVRLLNYRVEKQRESIDSQFRKICRDKKRKMISYFLDFMPGHSEVPYIHVLLD